MLDSSVTPAVLESSSARSTSDSARPHFKKVVSQRMPQEIQLAQVLDQITREVAPLWPLKDMVAVNPFLGLTDQHFLQVQEDLGRVRSCEMLPPLNYFQHAFAANEFSLSHVHTALRECQSQWPQRFPGLTDGLLEKMLHAGGPSHSLGGTNHGQTRGSGGNQKTLPKYQTAAVRATGHQQSVDWQAAVLHEVSKICATHFDEGQAVWRSPWSGQSLFAAWQQFAGMDLRIQCLGLKDFCKFVKSLPVNSSDAIATMLHRMSVPAGHTADYLRCVMYSIPGWASYAKYASEQASDAAGKSTLVDLIAIVLAYETALIQNGHAKLSDLLPAEEQPGPTRAGVGVKVEDPNRSSQRMDVAARYVLQRAMELAYGQPLLKRLLGSAVSGDTHDSGALVKGNAVSRQRRLAQMVFCIDVRSEILRRHLETASQDAESAVQEIETLGFAGFFGLPIAFQACEEILATPQCPALLKPSIRVVESPVKNSAIATETTASRIWRKIWKTFQASTASCFPFVESCGLLYLWHLARRVGQRSANIPTGLPTIAGLTLQQQVDLAQGILSNLGLTDNFARIVVFCGHGCQTQNNPMKATLDCGACGGHSGEVNARVAAMLLNDPHVREGLASRGVLIPADTRFLAAVHNTTTDVLSFFEADLGASESVPATRPMAAPQFAEAAPQFAEDLARLQRFAGQASLLTRQERSLRLGGDTANTLLARGQEWSEVRPEWGLAGNAAFIVAPRARTAHLKLDGRTFLHNYSQAADPAGKTLELILTAPMVVANWINLQYFASSVDNENFGSGNKVLHNVVGTIGILEGNGGDLRGGLSMQSLHDGQQWQHQALRLLVVVEASREAIDKVLNQHRQVRDLVTNQWLHLVAIETEGDGGDEQAFEMQGDGDWKMVEFSPDTVTVANGDSFVTGRTNAGESLRWNAV